MLINSQQLLEKIQRYPVGVAPMHRDAVDQFLLSLIEANNAAELVGAFGTLNPAKLQLGFAVDDVFEDAGVDLDDLRNKAKIARVTSGLTRLSEDDKKSLFAQGGDYGAAVLDFVALNNGLLPQDQRPDAAFWDNQKTSMQSTLIIDFLVASLNQFDKSDLAIFEPGVADANAQKLKKILEKIPFLAPVVLNIRHGQQVDIDALARELARCDEFKTQFQQLIALKEAVHNSVTVCSKMLPSAQADFIGLIVHAKQQARVQDSPLTLFKDVKQDAKNNLVFANGTTIEYKAADLAQHTDASITLKGGTPEELAQVLAQLYFAEFCKSDKIDADGVPRNGFVFSLPADIISVSPTMDKQKFLAILNEKFEQQFAVRNQPPAANAGQQPPQPAYRGILAVHSKRAAWMSGNGNPQLPAGYNPDHDQPRQPGVAPGG